MVDLDAPPGMREILRVRHSRDVVYLTREGNETPHAHEAAHFHSAVEAALFLTRVSDCPTAWYWEDVPPPKKGLTWPGATRGPCPACRLEAFAPRPGT